MMNSVLNNDELCIKNDELCIKNDEFCIKNDDRWTTSSGGSLTGSDFIILHYFALKSMEFLFKMMNFGLKMMRI